jgi:hypothetical protein
MSAEDLLASQQDAVAAGQLMAANSMGTCFVYLLCLLAAT